MKTIIKKLYERKIRITTLFNWGYGEISSYVNTVKDIAIILGFIVLVFKIHIGIISSLLICLIFFIACIIGGLIMEKSGMLKYGNRITNHQNAELMEILEILKK